MDILCLLKELVSGLILVLVSLFWSSGFLFLKREKEEGSVFINESLADRVGRGGFWEMSPGMGQVSVLSQCCRCLDQMEPILLVQK